MSYLQISGLKISYGDKVVLHNIDLAVEQGEMIALLGPSGCGKTTLLNALCGFKFWPQPGFYIIHHILIARGGDVENGVGLCAKAQEEGRYDRCFRLSQHGLSPE